MNIDYNKNSGVVRIGQEVEISGDGKISWKNTDVEVMIHKMIEGESIWVSLSTKKVLGMNIWQAVARMRAPGSSHVEEIQTDKYCHTFDEVIDLFKDSFPAEYNAFIDFMQ